MAFQASPEEDKRRNGTVHSGFQNAKFSSFRHKDHHLIHLVIKITCVQVVMCSPVGIVIGHWH